MDRILRLRSLSYQRHANLQGTTALLLVHTLITMYYSTLFSTYHEDVNSQPKKPVYDHQYAGNGSILMTTFLSFWKAEVFIVMKSFPNCLWIILLVLPFLQNPRWAGAWADGTFTLIFTLCCILLEYYGSGSHWMFGYMACGLVIRLMLYRHVWICFASTIAYLTAFRINIPEGEESKYSSFTFCIVQFSFISTIFYGIVTEKVYRSLCNRLWDHIHILLVLKEKAKRCHLSVIDMVSGHLCPVVIEHIFPSKLRGRGGNKIPDGGGGSVGGGGLDDDDGSNTLLLGHTPPVVKSALRGKLIFDSKEARKDSIHGLSSSDLKMLKGVDKRFCALVAIRVCPRTGNEIISEHERFALNAVIDEIAHRHKVAHVRNYGTTWVGCAGFFEHDDAEEDASENELGALSGSRLGASLSAQFLVWETLIMAFEVHAVMKHLNHRVIVAMEANKITGGFLGKTPSFDFFGSEIRWVMRVTQEFPLYDDATTLLGAGVRSILQARGYGGGAKGDQPLEFVSRRFSPASSNHAAFQTTEQAYTLSISGLNGAKNCAFVSEANMRQFVSLHAEQGGDLQWIDGYKNLFSEYNALLQSQNEDVLNAAVNSEEDEIKKILTEWSFEVVSSDFLNHCDPKYRAILQDPILDHFSDEQILEWHKSSLQDVQELIRRHFFSSFFHYFALIKKEDWIGWNDWRPNTIDRLMGRELSSESCEPAAPFEVLKSLLAAIHIRIPFLSSERGTTTTSNQKKYEAQKQSTQHSVLPGQTKPRPKKVVPNNSDLPSSAAQNQNNKTNRSAANEKSRDKMNFTEFRREVMLVSSNPLTTACSYAVFFMCTIYCFVSFPAAPDNNKGNYNSTVYGFMWGLMLSKISIQRNFDGFSYALQAWMVFFGSYKFPVSDAMCRAPNLLITPLGDIDGESIMFAYIAMIFSADVRIPLSVLLVLNCAGAMGINLPNRSTIDCGGAIAPHRLQMTTYMSLTFVILRWIMDYTVYVVFIVETELTPASLRFYKADLVDARNLLLLFEPALKHDHNESLVLPRKYPECTVITVNVKASAFLAGILDCKQFETIYGQVSAIINKSIAEFGLLKVTEFAGIVTIVECKELSDRYLRAIYRETSRTAFFLKTLQQRVEDYAVANKFNVELDIGIDHGPAMVGLLGGRTHSLDLTGRTRDFSQIISSLSLAVSGKAQTIISGSFAADIRAMRHFSTHFVMRPASLLYRASRLPIHLVEQAFSGMTLDDFDLIAMLGRGGYGSVHLVREVKTAQLYAVKVIPQKASLMASVLDREFRALQRLNYPNVVSFKYSLMNDAKVYLFMNYVEGGTLQQVVDEYEPPVAHLTFWFAELTLAIEYVHSVGILHRDVKPANCMIGTDGHLRLCDFGLSKSIPKENNFGKHAASSSMSRTHSSNLLGNSTEKNQPLDPETLRTLERLMPVKSRLQENFKEASYSILLVPLNLSQTPVSAPSHKALLDMFFSVTLAASFDDAKALLANKVKAEVVIIELGSFLGARGGAAVTAVDGTEQDGREELLEILRACLREINAPGSAFKDIPIMVLSLPSFFEEKTQQSLKREFLPLKHFLNAPLSFYDRATLMYFGRMARNALSDNEFMDKLAEHLQSTAASPAPTSDTFPTNFPANLARKEPDNMIVRAGTALFMAPEIILRGEYSKAIDWWACGVSFYYCTTRSYLVNCSTTADALRKISKVEMDVSALRPYSPPLEDLVRGLLNRDVSERLGTQSAQQIRNHAFFKHLNWTNFQLVPPFKPDAELQTRVKNIPLFYGNTFRPKHPQGGPAPREPETNNGMSRSPGASLKMTKTIAKQQLKQELVRFSSLQSMRESWIRQSAEGSTESFKEQRARRGGGGADGEDAFTGSFGMSFFQQDSCMSIQEEREGSKGSGSRGSGSEPAGNLERSSREEDRGKLEFL